jgi:alpha/beta superfamily hydrolase
MVSGMTAIHASVEMDSPSVASPVLHSAHEIPPRSLRSITIPGPAGHIEALLNEGAPDAPFAALVCHPHPAGGGTMHNKVVYHAMKVMNDHAWGFRWPTLRFNFRGTGLSQGTHSGTAESGDIQAALAWLQAEFQKPIVVAGFSFGAVMALKACCVDKPVADVRALAILGLPTRNHSHEIPYTSLSTCTLPKLFLSGVNDQFAPAADLVQVAAAAHQPKQLALIPGADHFFTGRIEPMQQALCDWLRGHFPIHPSEHLQ